jgi:7-cyano-7-deazaguanine reductase
MIEMIALGRTVTEYEGLQIILVSDQLDEIVFVCDEVQALCPVTGQPDLYHVKIVLHQTNITIETKTLKLYIQSLRDRGIFAEDLAVLIREEILEALQLLPAWSQTVRITGLSVTTSQKSRGGIQITSTASRKVQG